MRINNQFLTGISVGASGAAGRSDKSRSKGRPAPPVFVTSPELSNCLALAALEPETREEVMDRVQVRLASGFYDSAESAEHTALALLRSAG